MGSRSRPRLSGTTASNSSVPDMWKLLVLGLVLSSLAARTTYAKVSEDSDLIFDNVRTPAKEVAAMVAASEAQKPTKNEFGSSLDDILNLDDEFDEDRTDILDAVDSDDDDQDDEVSTVPAEESGGWLASSVNRVRREIKKLLGAEEEEPSKETKPKKVKKGKKKERKTEKQAVVTKDKPKKEESLKDKTLAKKRLLAARNKRQGLFNYIFGNEDEEDDEFGSGEEETYDIKNYRLTFIVREIWNHNFADEHSYEFKNMSDFISTELVNFFDREYKEMDSDYQMNARVVHIAETTDPFQIHVTVDVEVTGDIEAEDLDNKFYSAIRNYQAIGNVGVEADTNYSFLKLDDAPEIDPYKIYPVTASRTTSTLPPTQTERSVCREGEFICDSGMCIEESQRCDSIIDCDDESDEANCPEESSYNGNDNAATDTWWNQGASGDTSTVHAEVGCRGDDVYRCEYSGTEICDVQRCDGVPDCPHGEDEEECGGGEECQNYEFACAGKCILLSQRCDGIQDCLDGLDELECPTKPSITDRPEVCRSDEHQCRDGACIPSYKLCDRHRDCRDGDDEENCPGSNNNCTRDEYMCITRECIPRIAVCDGRSDCPHREDESSKHCKCQSHEFKCLRGGGCIQKNQRCDGTHQCYDGSDEDHCDRLNSTDLLQGGCPDNKYRCADGICIASYKRCNGINDCADNSDEQNCPPSPSYDYDDDTSIELEASNNCAPNEFECDDSTCITIDLRCNGYPDCLDETDELECSILEGHGVITPDHCSFEEFFCDGLCHPRSIVCDGRPDCTDRADEAHCTYYNTTTPSYPTRYPCPELTCPGNAKCYRYAEKCDGVPDCDDGYDERDCCRDDHYKCNDGTCIDKDAKCNGRQDCPDGSDEFNCIPPPSRCLQNQWACDNGQCISAYAKCDGRADCTDFSDERDCPPEVDGKECGPNMFRCENGPCISKDLRCNGRNDCPFDISDELDCGHITNEINTIPPQSDPQLDLKTYPSSQTIKESREVVFRCRDEGPTRARVKWSRPGGRPLPIGFTDVNGRLEIPNIRTEDAGEYVCEASGYPSYVRGQSVTVHLTVEKYNPLLDRPPQACGYHEATCMNGECIPKSSICDGIPHCSDGSDEHSCSHGRKCSPNQFMCRNTKCVDRTWRCDGEDDCGDRSDEESCDPNPSESPCRSDEFQCRSNHCIPKAFQCDGTNECRDGSDEVGCMAPAVISPPPPRVDIPVGSVLNITCRAIGVPTPLIIWRLNWGHVPDNCISTSDDGFGNLVCQDMQVSHSGAYSCEVINTKGGMIVSPDTIVTVIDDHPRDVCPAGFFNALAIRREECVNCFCFGVSNQCRSADLFVYNLPPPITSHKVVGVEIQPYGDVTVTEFSGHDLISLRHGVQFRASNLPYSRQMPYLALPEDYLGSQLKSYGGYLKYETQFIGSGRPVAVPDVILVGNGYTLSYHSRQQLEPNIRNQISVQFSTGQWTKNDGRQATREEIMMALADVQHLLIRLQYIDATEREVELTHITMDSAGITDVGLGQAGLVEQCTCPTGYIGSSCERCAPGYVRQRGGAWLGRCVPEPLPSCPTGTYGDPNRGIPCRTCPCPLTNPENYFARGCSLGPDGDVICHCQTGYTGRRCEVCDSGYEGNPLQPGSSCRPIPASRCDPHGTNYTNPDGSCTCKALVTGPYCDMCISGSFHLNEFYPLGCIECFCSGVTQSCSSSNWYRDTIQSRFSGQSQDGFDVISNTEAAQTGMVNIQNTGNELQFEGSYITDVLYWSLPSKYLGNKLGVFGGKLSYTLRYSPMPGGLMSKNTAPDVVLKSANDIVLTYFRKSDVPPSIFSTHTIPMVDTEWRRQDKGKYNRAYFLMALADIEAIYIKATYTTTTQEAALEHVSLETATTTNLGTPRAFEVEQCACPVGYTGLSCERCAPGYKRSPEAGLYLGFCEPCECNGHSSECDPETGYCLNCRDNTEGEMCNECAPGFVGNATGGSTYDCRRDVSIGETICNCDFRGYVRCEGSLCQCKTNVEGYNCDHCRRGTFNLDEHNPDGCSECFCSGVSTTCASAYYRREQIPIVFFADQPNLANYDGHITLSGAFDIDYATNQVTHNKQLYNTEFWSLPGRVLGNQVRSYGGQLHFTLNTEAYGSYVEDQDIILRGNGIKLYWSRPPGTEDQEDVHVRLHESEGWYRQDRTGVHPASRHDIMTVLSNLQHILIRANPKASTTSTSLRNVVLDTAVQRSTEGSGTSVNEVEACVCPPGYDGTSCESCAKLYYRNETNVVGLFGACQQCPCKEGAESCSMQPNGIVECHCMRGFSGDRCQFSGEGPTPRPPIRPEITISVTVTSPIINIVNVGESITFECSGQVILSQVPLSVSWYKVGDQLPPTAVQSRGYLYLTNLQIHDSGTYVCQAQRGDEIVAKEITLSVGPEAPSSPSITVTPPQVDIDEYQSSEVYCEARGNPRPVVSWSRVGASMPSGVYADGNRLVFQSARQDSQGSYRCLAENNVGSNEYILAVYIRPVYRPPPVTPPPGPATEVIFVEPPEYHGRIGEVITLRCRLRTTITVTYEWLKDNYDIYRSRNIDVRDNTLTIREAAPSDTGSYTCRAVDPRTGNQYTSTSYVTVETDGGAPPRVHPLQPQHLIIQGQDLNITCDTSGTPYPTVKWTKLHETLDSNVQQTGNTLRILNAQTKNRGVYLCIAESPAGSDQSSTVVDVEPRERPLVEIHPREPQTVRLGESVMLNCRSIAGIPEPTLTWHRSDRRPLPPKIRETYAGTITISDIDTNDAGDYECHASNVAGSITATTTIHVIQPPIVTIYPNQEDIEVTEGDELRLTCEAIGRPQVSVKWLDGSGREMQSHRAAAAPYASTTGSQEAILDIFHVTLQDANLYSCHANNIAGEDRKYINVRVKPKRGDVGGSDVDIPPPAHPDRRQTYLAEIGDRTVLSCNIAQPTNVRTTWERIDGRPLPSGSQYIGNDLIINGLTEDAAGVYRCYAIEHDRRVPLISAELVLSPIPRISFSPPMPMTVRAGDTVNIFCNATGEQPIYVQWHAENQRPLPPSVSAQGPYLRFNAIKPADAGRYYCSASNRRGNVTKVAEVLVNREVVTDRPSTAQVIEVYEGNGVSMDCNLGGYNANNARPDFRFQWTRQNGPVSSSARTDTSRLYLHNVRREDEGRYICEVRAPQGLIGVKYVDLVIKRGSLPVLKLDPPQSYLRTGESTEVECHSTEGFVDVIWERADGRRLPPNIRQVGNKLVIVDAVPSDSGDYICRCRTDGGDEYSTNYALNIQSSSRPDPTSNEVSDTPRQTKKPKVEHAEVGSTVILKCDSGDVRASYKWSRQSGQFPPGKDLQNSELLLSNVQAKDAGTYICTVSSNGVSVDTPTILVVTGAIPHFHQAPLSYMTFPTLETAFTKFNIDITFKPEQPNGLILYNGQKKGSGDYIALSLNDQYPEFRFDFGNSPTIIRSERPISLGDWHTLKISRFRRDGYMIVDDQPPVAFPPPAQLLALDLIEHLSIGGVARWEDLPPAAVARKTGFVGCVSRLVLQDKVVELNKDALHKEGITSCEPCANDPCDNDGVCLESQTEAGYTCICQEGFTGKNCAVEGSSCMPGICGVGRCENTESGMECFCPLNKTGNHCEYVEFLEEGSLSFKDGSYAAYKTPRPSKLNIKFHIHPNSLDNSVVMYVAESERVNGDFAAVLIKDKHLELRINTGARLKPVVIRSINALQPHKWTEVEIGRKVGEGYLKVGNEPEQTGKAAGPARSLYLKTYLYLGGYDKRILLNRDVNITRGFDGCISNLQESNRKISMISDILDAANVQNCRDNNEITPPAINGKDNHYTDSCSREPCENGGTCIPEGDEFTCHCPLGHAGRFCEEHVKLDLTAHFRGNGYLELDRNVVSNATEQFSTTIAVLFSTASPNGLLLWFGQEKGQQYTGQDYVALAVVDGILECSYRLDGEEAIIRTTAIRVDDGRRHVAIIKRTGNQASLELDHLSHYGETRPTAKNEMHLPGHLFIGGAQDLVSFTGNRYTYGFSGCIHAVEGEVDGGIILGLHAVTAVNVDSCPNDDFIDELEGPEPPVV